MAFWSGFGLSGGMVAVGAAATVAVAGFVGYQFLSEDETLVPDAPVVVELAAIPEASEIVDLVETPVEIPAATPEVPETPELPAAPDPAPIAPSFDLVRVDAAGGAVIAGRAEPGADLRLRLDGQEIHLASSDGAGAFVAMLSIPPSELPQVLSLEMVMAGGDVLISDQSVIIQPATRTASAEPAPDASPALPTIDAEAPALASTTDAAPVTTAPTAPQLATPDLPDVTTEAVEIATEATIGQTAPVIAEAATELAELATADAATAEIATQTETAQGDLASAEGVEPVTEDPVTELAMLETASPDPTETPDIGAQDSVVPADGPPETPTATAIDLATVASETADSVSPEIAAASAPELIDPTPATEAPEAPVTTVAPEVAEVEAAPQIAATTQAATPEISEAAAGSTSETAQVTEAPETSATELAALPQVPETPASETSVATVEPDIATVPEAPATEIAAAPAATDTPTPSSTTQTTAPMAPTVMIADSQGIRVVQAGGPEPQAQIVLDTIAYDTAGEVVLTGRGPAQADVRLYLDNQPVQLAQIDLAGGWSTQLPQVDPGTYTLRVDEVSAAGTVLSRVETPFLRETPAVLDALPQRDGVSVITVQPGHTLWGIARDHLGDGVLYVQVYQANRDLIRDPHWIYPGQIFAIPDELRGQ